jgi:hypothetical protein
MHLKLLQSLYVCLTGALVRIFLVYDVHVCLCLSFV